MDSQIRLGRLFGFEIYAQPIGLILLAIISFGVGGSPSYGLFVLVSLLAAVTLHEVGHAYVAKSRGMWVPRIILHAFGGVTLWQGQASWRDKFWITAAGPMVNFILGIAAYLLLQVTAPFAPISLAVFLSVLFYTNILLGIFNILPVHPLDGGVLLHTVLLGKYGRNVASLAYLVGMVGGALMLVYGIFSSQLFMAAFGGLFGWQNWQLWNREGPEGGVQSFINSWKSKREREWLRKHRPEVDAAMRQSFDKGIHSLSEHQKDLLRRARQYDEWRN